MINAALFANTALYASGEFRQANLRMLKMKPKAIARLDDLDFDQIEEIAF